MCSKVLEQRIRAKWLMAKLTSPEEAARFVKNGMALGIGTGASNACPKTFFSALAKQLKGKGKIKLFTGGPVPYDVDGVLVEADILERRFGQFSDKSLIKAVNERDIPLIDVRTGILPHQVRAGRFGKMDIAVIQAAAITEEGYIVPTTSCLDAPSYTVSADKIIVEINTDITEEIEGIHDIYIPALHPKREPILLSHAGERIGDPFIVIDPDKIVAIFESTVENILPPRPLIDKDSQKIAALLLEFLVREVEHDRLPASLLPIQFGIGKVPEALSTVLCDSPFAEIEIFSGAIGDGGLDLIDAGKVKVLSASGLYFSKEGFERFYKDISRYKSYIVLRPVGVSDFPELIARLGNIAINGALEVDIYGHVNSSHIFGSRIISGIGGSFDFLSNAYLSIIVLPSFAREGTISCIVPMVTHVDQTEHTIDLIITEQGLADLRGLAPVERAETIINNCAHPKYRPFLEKYLNEAIKNSGGHEPHILDKAFKLHLNYLQEGTMYCQL